jgi:hypothetical protein
MGRRNKVVKKRGDVTSHLQDAVSDEETNETIWEDQLYDQVDIFVMIEMTQFRIS